MKVCKCELSEAVEAEAEGGSNSVVESQPSKLLVAGSIPVSRSSLRSPANESELRLGMLNHADLSGRSLKGKG